MTYKLIEVFLKVISMYGIDESFDFNIVIKPSDIDQENDKYLESS